MTFKTWFVIYELHPAYITKIMMHELPSFLSSAITNIRFRFTGFELMYHVSGNRIHFSIFKIQIFPPSQKITVSIIQFLIPKQKKTNFISAAIKSNLSNHLCPTSTLKLKAINPGYLKKYFSGKTFTKLTRMQIQ